MMTSAKKQTLLVFAALACTYFIWGSTYLAVRFAIESFPPFLMVGWRSLVAGVLLYILLWLSGSPHPKPKEWFGAGIVGILLMSVASSTVTHVQLTVSSSVAALSIATVPIWMAVFSSLWGHKITTREWLGIAIGFVGIALLNMGGSLHGDIKNALLLMFAAATWSFGSVWGKHLLMPKGLMGAACQLLIAGLVLLMLSAFADENWPAHISQKSWSAMAFLIVLGSMVTYSAYQYLLKTVRPLVAASNTFVNPIVAFIVGTWLANETVAANEYMALAVILVGVYLVLTQKNMDSE